MQILNADNYFPLMTQNGTISYSKCLSNSYILVDRDSSTSMFNFLLA